MEAPDTLVRSVQAMQANVSGGDEVSVQESAKDALIIELARRLSICSRLLSQAALRKPELCEVAKLVEEWVQQGG